MILTSILILIVAIALPSINSNISSLLYIRIASIIFIYAGVLTFNALYIQSIGSGIGVYNGLFQVTLISQFFDIFIVLIGLLILVSWPLMNNNTSNFVENDSTIILDKNLISINNYPREYSLIVLISTLGASILISFCQLAQDLISLTYFLKISFILFFFFFHFYLIYKEYISNSKILDFPVYKSAGLTDGGLLKSLRTFSSFIVGSATIYGTALAHKSYTKDQITIENLNKEIENLTSKNTDLTLELDKANEENIALANLIEKNNSSITIDNLINPIRTAINSNNIIIAKAKSLLDIKKEQLLYSPDSKEFKKLDLNFTSSYNEYLSLWQKHQNKITDLSKGSIELLEELQNISKINKSTIISFFNFEDLDIIGKLSLSLLFLNYAGFSALITIIFILYGDSLLNKYKLEEKFPLLAKIIKNRKKLSRYSLFLNFFIIAMIFLVETIFSIYILTS